MQKPVSGKTNRRREPWVANMEVDATTYADSDLVYSSAGPNKQTQNYGRYSTLLTSVVTQYTWQTAPLSGVPSDEVQGKTSCFWSEGLYNVDLCP